MSRDINVEELFIALAHGDRAHRDWLWRALEAYKDREPPIEPYGVGTKEHLQNEISALWELIALADDMFEQSGGGAILGDQPEANLRYDLPHAFADYQKARKDFQIRHKGHEKTSLHGADSYRMSGIKGELE